MMRVPIILVTLSVLIQAAWVSAKHVKDPEQNVGVYGGDFISIDDAPWMALVYTGEKPHCSGTIVNQNYVLTIDTCCNDHGKSRNDWHVRVGSDGRREQGHSVKITDVYPFTHNKLKPVPCLLKLKEPLSYNEKLKPVNLTNPEDVVIENGTQLDFAAFGRPEQHEENYGLRRTKLPVDDVEWCKQENIRLNNGQLCAGDHEHNACAGDGGGALTWKNHLIGILSEAHSDCKSNPARFCRISRYRDWIKKITGPN